MPRPTTKQTLLDLSEANFRRLNELIDSYGEEQRHATFPPGTLNRNIRDVVAHLHRWNLMLLEWYEVGMAGGKPKIPAEGFTWKTLPALNRLIQEEYQNLELHEARQLLTGSYSRVRQLMLNHSEEELFEKKRYKWTGSTSLAAYLISATSSHYDWGYKLIKKSIKALVV